MRVNEGKTYGGGAASGGSTAGSNNYNRPSNGAHPPARQGSLPLRPSFPLGIETTATPTTTTTGPLPYRAFSPTGNSSTTTTTAAAGGRATSPGSPQSPPPHEHQQQRYPYQPAYPRSFGGRPVLSTDAPRYSQSGSATTVPSISTSTTASTFRSHHAASPPPPAPPSDTRNSRYSVRDLPVQQHQPAVSVAGGSTGRVQGILKASKSSASDKKIDGGLGSSSNSNSNNNKSGTTSTSVYNALYGQKVTDAAGLDKPIKSLGATLSALRAGKPPAEAFESKEASYQYKRSRKSNKTTVADRSDDGDDHDDDEFHDPQSMHKISYLSVYFPMRKGKDHQHDPLECGKLCNGAPHFERGPVCRICLTRISPNLYKDNPVFNARACLDHLHGCSGLTNLQDRELLYNGFREGDKDLIEDYKTSEWKSGLSLASEHHAVLPHMAPRRAPMAAAAAAARPVGGGGGAQHHDKPRAKATTTATTSAAAHATAATTLPIAAKNIPNRSSNNTSGFAGQANANRQTSQNRLGSSSGSASVAGSAQPPPRKVATNANTTTLGNDRGWGVSSRNASYMQHVAEASAFEERDELDSPQHDPEDNFTWQAVKSPNASTVAEEAPNDASAASTTTNMPPPPPVARATDTATESANEPPPGPPPPSPRPAAEVMQTPHPARQAHYGAEVIIPIRPASASRRPSPVPSRPSSRASHRSSGSTNAPAQTLNSLDLLHSVRQSLAGASISRPRSPLYPPTQASQTQTQTQTEPPRTSTGVSAPTSSGRPMVRTDPDLFRPLTPPSSVGRLVAKAEPESSPVERAPSPEAVAGGGPGNAALLEPELPPDDEWDLIPEPGFEPLDFDYENFIRSGAPSLESKHTPRDLSISPEPSEEVTPRANLGTGALPDEPRTRRISRSPSVELLNPIKPVVPAPRHSGSASTTAGISGTSTPPSQEPAASKPVAATVADSSRDPTPVPVAQQDADDASSDSSEDMPLRKMPSSEPGAVRNSQISLTGTTTVVADSQAHAVVDLASDSDSTEEDLPPRLFEHGSPPAVRADSTGQRRGAASKVDRKGKGRQREPSVAAGGNDDSSDLDSSSESDAVYTTSVRVRQVDATPSHRSPSPPRQSLAKGSSSKGARKTGRPVKKRARTPSPSPSPTDASESEYERLSPPRPSQAAGFVRRFQRFADRDRSPEDEEDDDEDVGIDAGDESEELPPPIKHSSSKRNSTKKAKSVKSRKSGMKTDRKQNKKRKAEAADSSPPQITRRRLDEEEVANTLAEKRKSSKKRAKAIRVSDEEEDTPVHRKRLKTYQEKQAELAEKRPRKNTSKPSSDRSVQPASSSPTAHSGTPVGEPVRLFTSDPDFFFVDVEKNHTDTMPLPVDLEPWADVFNAVDILSLDTLQSTVRHPENADAFVQWLAKRTKCQDLKPIANQFPLVQAIQRVLGGAD